MEKLNVEIEVSKEDMEAFNQFMVKGCYNRELYLKRILANGVYRAVDGHRTHGYNWEERKAALEMFRKNRFLKQMAQK